MKSPLSLFPFRTLIGTAAAGAGLLCASGAFAQAPPVTSTFEVVNSTFSGGDPVYSVTDDLTFTNLQVMETFANGFSQTILFPDLTTAVGAESNFPFIPGSPLTSAILTGTLNTSAGSPGSAFFVTVQPGVNDPTTAYQQYISDTFSANLLAPTVPSNPEIALGQFALNTGNNISVVNIDAVPAAVPEASTTVSLGLLLALGLGGLVVARRRTLAA